MTTKRSVRQILSALAMSALLTAMTIATVLAGDGNPPLPR